MSVTKQRKRKKLRKASPINKSFPRFPYFPCFRSHDGMGLQLNMERVQNVFQHVLDSKIRLLPESYTRNNSTLSLASLSRGNFTLFKIFHISHGITTFKQSLTRTQNSPASAATRYHKSRVP